MVLPEDDAIQYSAPETNGFLPEFHKFCDIHFDEGLKIASVCEFINNKISYKAEGEKDYWQSPKETLRLGTGDCEDVVLLFAYLMKRSRIQATYCWGECQNDKTQFAHTWVELRSRENKTYVVEFFNRNVSYSIFASTEDNWARKRHVVIAHNAFCMMAETKFIRQRNVFNKLGEVFERKHD